MTTTELLAELRAELFDFVAPYHWSDTTLMGYLSEGQDRFCEQTGFFVDKTNYTITTQAGVKEYAISSRIIKVLELWDGTRRLTRFDESERPFVTATGENTIPVHWQTDGETNTLTLYEPPTAGIVLTMRVWRKARTALAAGVPLEIPPEFHRACIEYAAGKAYIHHDAELQNPVKAADHRALFREYCQDGARAFRRISGGEITLKPSSLYSFT